MDTTPLTQAQLWSALLPWIIVCVVMLIWGTGWFKTCGEPDLHLELSMFPSCDNMINKVPPVAAKPTPEGAVFVFTYLSFTGTGMLIAAIISGFLMGLSPGKMVGNYGRTIKLLRLFADHDLGDAGDRHADAAVGRRRDARSRLRRHRRAVSVLRHAAGLAGRGADRDRIRRRTSCSAICRRSPRSNSGCRRS